jgi:hypothetical protein
MEVDTDNHSKAPMGSNKGTAHRRHRVAEWQLEWVE